jgi:transcriptional regulator PpsR
MTTPKPSVDRFRASGAQTENMDDQTVDPQTTARRPEPVLPFARAAAGLDGFATADVRALLAAPADLALLIDGDGVIRDAAVTDDGRLRELAARWIGLPWGEIVAQDSRDKTAMMMRGTWQMAQGPVPAPGAPADTGAPPAWRHLNLLGGDENVPLSVCTVLVGGAAPVARGAIRIVAFGRDMRPLAAMQQRLVEAQQSMERDYLRFRHAETRYRHLFQVSAEGMLVVDAGTTRIVEANPAAAALLVAQGDGLGSGTPTGGLERLIGAVFPVGLDVRSHDALAALLATARGAGRTEQVRCELSDARGEVMVAASMFRQDSGAFFLIRLARAPAPVGAAELLNTNAMLLKLAQSAPDCLVVTDLDGRVLSANAAFVELVQLATEEQVRGESLDRWLGRTGVDLGVLISNLRQRGSVRLFATTLRGAYGATTEVEISATLVPHGKEAFLGFTIRDVGRRLSADARTRRELPRSVGQLTELVGRVPLKDIVGETTDLIEQLCIEAALELTRDNRASAAEMLGLSRQSLYVKLRRYGLGELGGDGEGRQGG